MMNEDQQFRYPAVAMVLGSVIVFGLGMLFPDALFVYPEPGTISAKPPSEHFMAEFNHIMKAMAVVLIVNITALIFYRP